MYKLKPAVVLFSLFSYGVANAALPPPTTIDVNVPGNSVSSPAIAIAPPSVRDEIVKSTRSMVADQVAEHQYSQLTPEEMYRIKSIELEKERIGANPYLSIPEPVVRSLAVSLNPGEQPPLVRVSKDMLTSIVFTDNDGQPWYIDKVTINRNQFSDAANMPEGANEAKPTNILTLEPNENFVFGNVSIALKGKALPVILILASGQPTVDMRVDARISGRNPDAAYVPGVSAVRAHTDIDNDALSFLDGSIPELAEPLIASDVAAQGWEHNNSLYVKSRLDVLFPAYSSRASTADGVNIYRFDTTTPNNSITLMQRQGQPVTVTFEPAPYYQYNQ